MIAMILPSCTMRQIRCRGKDNNGVDYTATSRLKVAIVLCAVTDLLAKHVLDCQTLLTKIVPKNPESVVKIGTVVRSCQKNCPFPISKRFSEMNR